MKPFHRIAAAGLAAAGFALGTPASANVDVGVSIGISQPGVYGRIDIGRFPQPPAVILPQPVIIAPQPVIVGGPPRPVQPVYLWVPPGHQKNWRKHCGAYNACGVPVYFVRDEWYERNVERRDGWRDESRRGGGGKGKGHDDDRGKGRGKKDD